MLDIKFVTTNPALIKENNSKRGYEVDVDKIIALDVERKRIQSIIDETRQKINAISKGWKSSEIERTQAKTHKVNLEKMDEELKMIQTNLADLLSWLPNILDPRVPIGDESKNMVLSEVGEIPKFDFKPKSHEELGSSLGIFDLERGVKVAGSRFYFLKNEAVLMRMALAQMFINRLALDGFTPTDTPCLAKSSTLFGTGYHPFSKKDNFKIQDSDLSLIGTSEQVLVSQHMGEVLKEEELPLKYIGQSMCYRTEIGNYGKDTKGLIRVHQFFKQEMIIICKPEEAEMWHKKALELEEWIMKELDVPYRVVLTASQDLAAPGHIKYDTEAWMASQNKYREMTSNTNLTDYQTRRLNIRYKNKDRKMIYPYTISATGFCDRLMLAIIELYQQEDGSVIVPEKLKPFMQGIEIIAKK